MIDACRVAGSHLAVNHQMQFMEQYTAVKEIAESEAMGGLRGIIISASNFGLSMNGSHYFEMLRYVSGGGLVDSVSFWADADIVPNPRGSQYQDRSGQVHVTMNNGMRAYMELGGDLGHGINVIYNCRYGQIQVDELAGKMRYVHRKEEYRDLPTTRYGMPADEHLVCITPADVLGPTQAVWEAMIAGREYPDGTCGRHAVAAVAAALLSAEQGGQPIRLGDIQSLGRQFPWA
jgi:predicted dehydrogenase